MSKSNKISPKIKSLLLELEQYSNGGFIIFMADEKGSPKFIDRSSTELTRDGLHCMIFQYIQDSLGLDIISTDDKSEEEDEEGSAGGDENELES